MMKLMMKLMVMMMRMNPFHNWRYWTADEWKFAAQVLAVAGGLSYWGYLSYMHTLIDVCDNLQRAFGVGSFGGNPDEFNSRSLDQTWTLIERSPSLLHAVKTCVKDGHAPYLWLADEMY